MNLVEHAIEAGFVPEDNRRFLMQEKDPVQLLEALELKM